MVEAPIVAVPAVSASAPTSWTKSLLVGENAVSWMTESIAGSEALPIQVRPADADEVTARDPPIRVAAKLAVLVRLVCMVVDFEFVWNREFRCWGGATRGLLTVLGTVLAM